MPAIDHSIIPKTAPSIGYGGGYGMATGFSAPFGAVIVVKTKGDNSGNGRPQVGIVNSRPRVNIVKVRPAIR